MAFRKLIDCDKSDMAMWANSKACANFVMEIETQRDAANRSLIKCKASEHDEHANRVKAFDFVLGLIQEAKNM